MPKKPKNHLILENQKLKKRQKSTSSTKLRVFVVPTIFIILGFLISFLFINTLSELSFFPKNNKINILVSDQIPEPESIIVRSYFEHKSAYSADELKSLPKEIQEITASKAIHVIALDHETGFLNVEKHEAEAVIVYGKNRLLSTEGKIFGTYRASHHAQLPVIKGIPLNEKIKFNEDQSVVLSKSKSSLVNDALLLIREGLRYNIKYKTILYNPDRGFRVWLKNKRIRVEMGRAPFNKRYMKLTKILSNLDKKRVAKARIELDYQGKAFIKEYSL